jgi:hypothetical protein
MFSNKYIYSLVGQLLPLILIFNIQACEGCKHGEDNTASIGMKIAQSLPLIGKQKDIEITFQKSNPENDAILDHFKLKVSILEEENLKGETTSGSQIQFTGAGKGEETFTDSEPFEKLLTEFTRFRELDQDNGRTEFDEKFQLTPANDAIRVKLKFELLDTNDKTIQDIEVEWIKSEIIVGTESKFEGEKTQFTIQSLKGDISDLSKIKVSLETKEEGVKFLLGETKKSQVTLDKLLTDTEKLAKDEVSNPIVIKVDNLNSEVTGEFTIKVFDTDAGDDSTALGKQLIKWTETGMDTPEGQIIIEKERKRKAEELKEKQLKEDEAENKEEIKEAEKNFKEKEEALKEDKKKQLVDLKKQEKEALESKSRKKEDIEEEFAGKRKAIKDKYKQDLEAAKKEFEDIKKADKGKEKADEDQEKKLKEQLKKDKKSNKKEEEGLKKKEKKDNENDAPQIKIMLKNRNVTDKKFTIELSNTEGGLKQEVAKDIKIWYEIKEHTGDITKVYLEHKGKSIAPGDTNKANLATLFKDEVVFNKVVEKLSKGKMEGLPFDIEGIDEKAEHMEIIIYVEEALGNRSHITVNWKSKEEEKKEKKEEKEKAKEKKKK